MTAPTALSTRHIYGINSNVISNGAYGDDNNIYYVSGQSTICFNRYTKRQRYIQTEVTEAITAFTVSSTKRYVAIAERGEKPITHIIEMSSLKRKKSFTAIENIVGKEIIYLQFSSDDTILLTLTGSPDWTLVCWDWNKTKILAYHSIGCPMYSCTFNPLDTNMISMIGKESVKFFRLNDKDLRIMDQKTFPEINFLSSCWLRFLDDMMITGGDDGNIYIFQHGEFISSMEYSPGIENSATSLVAILGGFIMGSKNGTIIHYQFVESKDRKLNQQFIPTITLKHDLCTGCIMYMFLDSAEENLGILSSDNQFLQLDISNPSKLSPDKLSYILTPFHGPKTITGIDICVRKPLILSSSKDNTIKLWNFQTNELELSKSFPEEAYSVALHPTGLHCVIGFIDKLRIYHILVDDIRLCLEIPIKGCKECKFNKSGNYLATVNGNGILVYDFYTGDKVADLRGHNSKVRSITWLDAGCYLASCGQDGAVYLWDIEGSKRIAEYLQKGTTYVSIIASTESVFVVGSDKMLRQLSLPDLNPVRIQDANTLLTTVALSLTKSVVISGTGEYGKPGYIRCYNYPLNGEYDEYSCTSTQVTKIRITPDENFLVVADDSGCIVIYELRARQDRFQRSSTSSNTRTAQTHVTMISDLIVVDNWSDDVLVTKNELDEKASAIMELKSKVDELKLHNDYQLKLKDMGYSDKMKETNEKLVQELEQRRTAYDLLKEDKNDLEIEYGEKIKQAEEEHQYHIQEIETTFQAQIMELVDNYQQLVRERDAQTSRLEEQRRQLVASHARHVEELVRDYDRKLEEEQHVRLQLEDQRGDTLKEVEEIQNQFEDDVDTEIENLRRTYDDKLTSTRDMTLKLKGENGIMKKKRIVYQREIEDQCDEIKSLVDKEKEYHAQIDVLDKEIKSHKKDIKIRDISITEKEKKIYELKKKNQELDKFKFVLDHKIRELKLQIEPRQVEIVKMKEKINEMDQELEKYHKSNSDLDDFIGVLRQRIENLQNEIKTKRQSAMQLENVFSHFRNDLKIAMAHIQSPSLLRIEAQKLVADHGAQSGFIKPRLEPEIEQEYHRHKEFLQKSIQQLKRDMENSLNTRVEANSQLRQQNLELIDSINRQREVNREIRNRVQADTGRFRRIAQSAGNKDYSNEGDGTINNSNFNQTEDDTLDPMDILDRNQRKIKVLESIIDELNNRKNVISSLLPPIIESSSSSLVAISPRGEDIVMPFVTAKTFPSDGSNYSNNDSENESESENMKSYHKMNSSKSKNDNMREITLPRIPSALPSHDTEE